MDSNVIAFRAGLLSVDEFLESLNDLATRHFDNKRARAPNDEIRRDFSRDPELSIVPYTRGALYAAELDAALRGATHGKRTLDDALRELYRRSRAEDDRAGLPAPRRPRFRSDRARSHRRRTPEAGGGARGLGVDDTQRGPPLAVAEQIEAAR